jgi:hypothetical protein
MSGDLVTALKQARLNIICARLARGPRGEILSLTDIQKLVDAAHAELDILLDSVPRVLGG